MLLCKCSVQFSDWQTAHETWFRRFQLLYTTSCRIVSCHGGRYSRERQIRILYVQHPNWNADENLTRRKRFSERAPIIAGRPMPSRVVVLSVYQSFDSVLPRDLALCFLVISSISQSPAFCCSADRIGQLTARSGRILWLDTRPGTGPWRAGPWQARLAASWNEIYIMQAANNRCGSQGRNELLSTGKQHLINYLLSIVFYGAFTDPINCCHDVGLLAWSSHR